MGLGVGKVRITVAVPEEDWIELKRALSVANLKPHDWFSALVKHAVKRAKGADWNQPEQVKEVLENLCK